MTEDEFDAAAQDSYKAALADMFTGVTPDMITLSVASGSIVVTADIATTYSPAKAQTMVVSVLAAATPATLSTSLGVSVTAVEAPVVAVVAISSPSPPAPPEGSSILGIIIAAVIAVVIIGFLIVAIIGYLRFKKSAVDTHGPSVEMGTATPEAVRPAQDPAAAADVEKALAAQLSRLSTRKAPKGETVAPAPAQAPAPADDFEKDDEDDVDGDKLVDEMKDGVTDAKEKAELARAIVDGYNDGGIAGAPPADRVGMLDRMDMWVEKTELNA